ncbi:MAG TPA: hypothetical protein V6D06_15430 [Trichocoleus sp.]
MNQPGYQPGPQPGYRPTNRTRDSEFDLFTAAAEPPVASTRFWMQLLRYRPVILLGSLWLGLICVAAVAYSRLMFAGVPPAPQESRTRIENRATTRSQSTRTGVEQIPGAVPTERGTPNGLTRTEPDLGLAEPLAEDTAEPGVEAAAEVTDGGVPVWSLGTLVGLCALGCFLMQRRVTAPPQARKARSDGAPPRGLKSAVPKRPQARVRSLHPAAQSAGPKRLEPFSPERDQIVVPNRPPIAPGPIAPGPVAPGPVAQDSVAQGLVPVPRVANQPQVAVPSPSPSPAPSVSVVPSQEAVPLDWPEGSLAHSLDMRQRRSLSSFL